MVAKWLLQLQTLHPSIGWNGKRRAGRDPSPQLPVISSEYLSQDHMVSTDQSLAERNDTAIIDLNQVLLGICFFLLPLLFAFISMFTAFAYSHQSVLLVIFYFWGFF